MSNLSNAEYAAKKYFELSVHEDCTLMDFLLKEMHGVSRNRVKDLLHGHAVSVDKKLTTQYDAELHAGQTVRVSRHKRSTELVNKYVKIVYEDKSLIVIEKAAGILSMGVPGQYCVKDVLDEYFRRRHFKCTAHVVHRLDRDTSGLMLYAKNLEVKDMLEQAWHEIVFDRRYVAVVSGKMEREGGTVHSWLKESKSYVTYSSPTDNGGKEATTYFRRIDTSDNYSLLELRLETGRKNQIRVHMKDIGHPVAGDEKYGDGHDPIGRLCLHAYRLFFYHPVTGVRMEFETPIPQAFLRIFKSRKATKPEEEAE